MGDLNSRTRLLDEHLSDPNLDMCYIDTSSDLSTLPARKNCDTLINGHGEKPINLCRLFNLTILNGRSEGDPLGSFTYCDPNIGSSMIDYGICNQISFSLLKNFLVLPQNELSDHCKIITELTLSRPETTPLSDEYDWLEKNLQFSWNHDNSHKFKEVLENSSDALEDIKQRLDAGLIDSTGMKIQEIYVISAEKTLKRVKIKNNPKSKSKRWFNSNCLKLKRQARQVSRQKHLDPSSIF